MLLSSIKSALDIFSHVVWGKYLEHTFFFWNMPHFPAYQPKNAGSFKENKTVDRWCYEKKSQT